MGKKQKTIIHIFYVITTVQTPVMSLVAVWLVGLFGWLFFVGFFFLVGFFCSWLFVFFFTLNNIKSLFTRKLCLVTLGSSSHWLLPFAVLLQNSLNGRMRTQHIVQGMDIAHLYRMAAIIFCVLFFIETFR